MKKEELLKMLKEGGWRGNNGDTKIIRSFLTLARCVCQSRHPFNW